MFDKPKVTIDLEEYNGWLKAKEVYESNDELVMAKEVALVALQCRGDQNMILRILDQRGITFWITHNQGNGKPAEVINFKRSNKK